MAPERDARIAQLEAELVVARAETEKARDGRSLSWWQRWGPKLGAAAVPLAFVSFLLWSDHTRLHTASGQIEALRDARQIDQAELVCRDVSTAQFLDLERRFLVLVVEGNRDPAAYGPLVSAFRNINLAKNTTDCLQTHHAGGR